MAEESSNKREKKAALKKEAEQLGIPYEELKKRRKKDKKREAESLESDEHKREAKRLRSYSKDGDDATAQGGTGRRRTRSMDANEEVKTANDEIKKMTPLGWRKENDITLQGHGANRSVSDFAAPYMLFEDTPFSAAINTGFQRAGFARPTAIQAQAWPLAIEGKDLICVAKTGSGKTCGFLLPVFHHYQQERGQNGDGGRNQRFQRSAPILLVLAPTRELSVQILEEAQKFGRPLGIKSVCCYGGSPKYPQIQALQRGVDCIIATPGRLNDLIEMRKADLSTIKYLVLDEADRMLDMGFEPQIRSIVAKVPSKRQTMLFSATWPKEIQRLAHDFLIDPVQVNVGEVDALVANKDITQKIIMCSETSKIDNLQQVLADLTAEYEASGKRPAGESKQHVKMIVFVAKKISCHDLANKLWDEGYAVDSLHGDRPQWERTKVMQAFKSSTIKMLVATDVAARGLDVKDVEVVINYDMPVGTNAVEDYVHRIGRTGRAGAKGELEWRRSSCLQLVASVVAWAVVCMQMSKPFAKHLLTLAHRYIGASLFVCAASQFWPARLRCRLCCTF